MTLNQIKNDQQVVYAQADLFDNSLFGKSGKIANSTPTKNGFVFVKFSHSDEVIAVDPVVLIPA